MFPWDSWHTIVPLCVGAGGIIAFGFYEQYLSTKAFDREGKDRPGTNIQPIIRFNIFSNWTLRLLYLQTMIHGMILWSLLNPPNRPCAPPPLLLLPLHTKSLTKTFLAISIIVGLISSRTGHYRWAIRIAWATTTLGFGLLYLLNPSTSIPAFIFLNVPVALGTGMAFVSMSLGIQAAARPRDAGHAITFYSFVRVAGQALGVGVGGVVLQNRLKAELGGYPALTARAEAFSRDSTVIVKAIREMEEGGEKMVLVKAYADSIKVVWPVMAALSGLVLVSTWFVRAYSLEQELETRQGFDYAGREEKETLEERACGGELR
ncbi:MAG: hypothetical protein Q9210_004976 [Variospora velana]